MLTVESVKKFLKPDWRKVTLVIIFILSGYLYINGYSNRTIELILLPPVKYEAHGLPIAYYNCKLTYTSVNPLSECLISYFNLIIDTVFWYFISCFVVFAWDKRKNKK